MLTAILKTWPAFMPRSKVLEVFTHDWGTFYFTLGRGKPQKEISELWYTHRGEIIGHFSVARVVRNMGDNLPKLHSITGEVSEWQIKLMNYVAVCPAPFFPLAECYGRVYHEAFRGWRYFDLETYRGSLSSKVRI